MWENKLYICIYSTKHLECVNALGMEDRAITDGQLTASSKNNNYQGPHRGRLNLKTIAGGWVAAKNDANQWLKIDLGSQYTKVTRVATQGRTGGSKNWVTKYKLQYRNDGVNWQHYREPGEATDKVT